MGLKRTILWAETSPFFLVIMGKLTFSLMRGGSGRSSAWITKALKRVKTNSPPIRRSLVGLPLFFFLVSRCQFRQFSCEISCWNPWRGQAATGMVWIDSHRHLHTSSCSPRAAGPQSGLHIGRGLPQHSQKWGRKRRWHFLNNVVFMPKLFHNDGLDCHYTLITSINVSVGYLIKNNLQGE